jgi:hypothetical protein
MPHEGNGDATSAPIKGRATFAYVPACQMLGTSELRSMPILDDGRLYPATIALLHAVSGVPLALLENCRVLPRRFNLLRFPWYSMRSGGGAFVLGERIYASGNFFSGSRTDDRALLFLLAHEVGHLPHAAAFPYSAAGKLRFILWSAAQYLASYLRHGNEGYRKARIEQEAERGRWVLRSLLASLPDPQDLMGPVLEGNNSEMEKVVRSLQVDIDLLHTQYPRW